MPTGLGAPPDASGGSRLPAPRMLAMRVDDSPRQLTLALSPATPQILVHEGARQTLERRLGTLLGEPLVLSITDNRRTMVSSRRREGFLQVRLHHMFLDGDQGTVRALASYLKKGCREASTTLGHYIERNGHRIRPRRRRSLRIHTQGRHHDLQGVFEELNQTWFEGTLQVRITWGRRGRTGGRRRRSVRLGAYSAEDGLIRIHPVLDQPWVPRFFVRYVVFHEMLHHVIPAPVRGGRTRYHTPEFRRAEESHPDYDRAIRWEQRNIHRLLDSASR
jgi:predicted SprT family Zn-dependent metalloprotease